MAHLDINMDGVKPQGEYQELPAGTYLVRIEETEKKPTKDRFDEHGNPAPSNGKNFYLQVSLKVYGGPNDGHVEFDRLNLWNDNSIAVNMAKSQLKSIFLATGVESNDSVMLHGKWMVMEVKEQRNKQLGKHYSQAPANIIPTDVPGVTATQQPVQTAQAQPQQQQVHYTQQPGYAATGAAPGAAEGGAAPLPSWAAKKPA